MSGSDRLIVVFAHNSEPLPSAFEHYPTPHNKPIAALSEKQYQKWKSQQLAHYLLHQIFEKEQQDTAQLASILRTESGRPYLLNPQIDFNISHSGEWVAVIVSISSQKKAVGIDIEHPQKTRRYLALLDYYAQPDEIREIQHHQWLPQLKHIEDRFYLSWCLREAVLKSQGVGIRKLSEVRHSLSQQTITSAYCPQGTLFFYHELPFYLAYFFEQPHSIGSAPSLYRWQAGNLVEMHRLTPIIYHVN